MAIRSTTNSPLRSQQTLLPIEETGSPSAQLQPLFQRSLRDYTLAEIEKLELRLKHVRQSSGKESPEYAELKKHVEKVRMAHLPLRTYAVWKQQSMTVNSLHIDNPQLTTLYGHLSSESKRDRQQYKSTLIENARSPEAEKKLTLLSRLTFLHGSNSAALAMMILTGKHELQSTGTLLSQGIAPMCGELRNGVLSSEGVNMCSLSVETIRDVKMVINYSKAPPFNPYWLKVLYHPIWRVNSTASWSKIWEQIKNIFFNPYDLELKEKDWIHFAIEVRQLQQWNFDSYQAKYAPYHEQWLSTIEKERAKQEKPLQQAIAMIEHSFTPKEKEFVLNAMNGTLAEETPVPSTLAHIFASTEEIPHLPNHYATIGSVFEYMYRWRKQGNWTEFLDTNLKAKLGENQDPILQSQIKPFYQSQLKEIEDAYTYVVSTLQDASSVVKIPHDKHIRSLISSPVPIVFSSTTVKVSPHKGNEFRAHEYLITKSTPLGKGGCDILFTDTEKSKERILSILPEYLRAEIEIHLFDELEVDNLPLIHNLDDVEKAK